MHVLRNNKGITIIVLVITIIVMLIIAGVTIATGITGTEEAKSNSLVTELNMVSHAVLERYTKASLTKEQYPGTITAETDLNTMKTAIESNGITLKGISTEYYTLTPDDGLKKLGIINTADTYIVNYKTGEVFNLTQKTTKIGALLYISNTSNN